MRMSSLWGRLFFIVVMAVVLAGWPQPGRSAPACSAIVNQAFAPQKSRAMHKAPGKSDPRCALRGHMWAAGCLLDWLKEGVSVPGNARKSTLALKRIEKLLATLTHAPPYSVVRQTGAAKRRAMRGFRACLRQTVRLAAKARAAVKGGRLSAAKTFVARMDAAAHRCHLKFVWPKYPPRKDGRCPPSIPDIF